MVRSIAWCLPRPRRDKYPGGFPLHFERRLLDLLYSLGAPRDSKILHPFSGKAEYGVRMDITPEVRPKIIANAHNLPFVNESFDIVILDPPFSNKQSQELYSTGPLHFKRYITEAARVLKPGGFIVMYHTHSMPGAPGCPLILRLLVETRVNHLARIVHIRQKDSSHQLSLIREESRADA